MNFFSIRPLLMRYKKRITNRRKKANQKKHVLNFTYRQDQQIQTSDIYNM